MMDDKQNGSASGLTDKQNAASLVVSTSSGACQSSPTRCQKDRWLPVRTASYSALFGGLLVIIDHLLWGPLPAGAATLPILGVAALFGVILSLASLPLLFLLQRPALRLLQRHPALFWRLGLFVFFGVSVALLFGFFFDPTAMLLSEDVYLLFGVIVLLALGLGWIFYRRSEPTRAKIALLFVGYAALLLWFSSMLAPYQPHTVLLLLASALGFAPGALLAVTKRSLKPPLALLVLLCITALFFIERSRADLAARDNAARGGRISRTILRRAAKYLFAGEGLPYLSTRARAASIEQTGAKREPQMALLDSLQEKRPTHVVWITIDTLREDLGGSLPPNFARLTQESIRFRSFYSSAPSTHEALQGFFLGWGSWMLRAQPESIFEQLQKRGWQNIGIVGTSHIALDSWTRQGFDTLQHPTGHGAEFSAQEINLRLREALSKPDGPLFVWLHYFEPHAPYHPGEGLGVRSRYQAEVARVDAALGEIFALIDDGPLRGALLIVTSDHGEEFYEHRGQFHGRTMFNETLRVPLWVRAPEGAITGEITAPTSGMMLAPALLRWLGVTPNDEPMAQLGLLPVFSFRDLLAGDGEASIVLGDYKLIYDLRFRSAMLYHLVRDVSEQENLIEREPEIAALLASLLQQEFLRCGLVVE